MSPSTTTFVCTYFVNSVWVRFLQYGRYSEVRVYSNLQGREAEKKEVKMQITNLNDSTESTCIKHSISFLLFLSFIRKTSFCGDLGLSCISFYFPAV